MEVPASGQPEATKETRQGLQPILKGPDHTGRGICSAAAQQIRPAAFGMTAATSTPRRSRYSWIAAAHANTEDCAILYVSVQSSDVGLHDVYSSRKLLNLVGNILRSRVRAGAL